MGANQSIYSDTPFAKKTLASEAKGLSPTPNHPNKNFLCPRVLLIPTPVLPFPFATIRQPLTANFAPPAFRSPLP
jgi:hypothetical protein